MEIEQIRYVANGSTWRRKAGNSRIFFSFDETILENLENRRLRPYNTLREFIPYILEKAQLGPLMFYSQPEARWSQKAGCGCGCSPGFVLDGQLVARSYEDHGIYDIHVKIK